jgi:hypothetical protein
MSFELPFSAAARHWRVFKEVGRSAVTSNVPFFQKFTAFKFVYYLYILATHIPSFVVLQFTSFLKTSILDLLKLHFKFHSLQYLTI